MGIGKIGIVVYILLYGGVYFVLVVEVDVIVYVNFIVVVQDWCVGQVEEQRIYQFDFLLVVVQQWGQLVMDVQIDLGSRVFVVGLVYVILFFVGYYF